MTSAEADYRGARDDLIGENDSIYILKKLETYIKNQWELTRCTEHMDSKNSYTFA